MRQEMCLVCNDKRKYEIEVSQTRNIILHLNSMIGENISNRFNREENELLRQLGMYNKHLHFICGNCYRVNTMELKNLEKKMDTLIVVIARKVEKRDRLYNETLRLLSGSYSGKYHMFQNYCLKKFNQELMENNENIES